MLSKSATMLLGLITHQPLNAYEIVKTLDYMNIKYWFNIGTSTVYATIKTLEKKQYLVGEIQKDGNMPDKTVYSITEQGKAVFLETLRTSFLKFDYDTNIFSITAFFLDCLPEKEQKTLLEQRMTVLQEYLAGIQKQHTEEWEKQVNPYHVANLQRMTDIVLAVQNDFLKLQQNRIYGNKACGAYYIEYDASLLSQPIISVQIYK